jgi:hypothetical protein
LKGATPGADGAEQEDLALPGGAPTLFLNLTIGNATHRFTSGAGGAGLAAQAGTANGTANVAPANGSAKANATAAANTTLGPGGDAPLNVSVSLGAKGLPTGRTVSWSLDFDADETAGQATGNATAAGNATASNATAPPTTFNGTEFPGQAAFVYRQSGSYRIVSSLTDGKTKLASLDLNVTVANGTATGVASGTVVGTLLLDETGTLTVAVQEISCDVAHGVGADATFTWSTPTGRRSPSATSSWC